MDWTQYLTPPSSGPDVVPDPAPQPVIPTPAPAPKPAPDWSKYVKPKGSSSPTDAVAARAPAAKDWSKYVKPKATLAAPVAPSAPPGPISTETEDQPFFEARRYLSTLPHGHPDRDALNADLLAAQAGDQGAADHLNSQQFPTSVAQPTNVGTTDQMIPTKGEFRPGEMLNMPGAIADKTKSNLVRGLAGLLSATGLLDQRTMDDVNRTAAQTDKTSGMGISNLDTGIPFVPNGNQVRDFTAGAAPFFVPVVGTGLGAATMAGNGYADAKEGGATDTQALVSGGLQGTAGAAFGTISKVLSPFSEGIAAKLGGNLAGKVVGSSAEGAVQGAVQNAATGAGVSTYDPEQAKEILANTPQAMLPMAALSGLTRGAHELIPHLAPKPPEDVAPAAPPEPIKIGDTTAELPPVPTHDTTAETQVQTDPVKDPYADHFPEWLPKDQEQEIRARFAPYELDQITGLRSQDPDNGILRVEQQLARLHSDSDRDSQNFVNSKLDEVGKAPREVTPEPDTSDHPTELNTPLRIHDAEELKPLDSQLSRPARAYVESLAPEERAKIQDTLDHLQEHPNPRGDLANLKFAVEAAKSKELRNGKEQKVPEVPVEPEGGGLPRGRDDRRERGGDTAVGGERLRGEDGSGVESVPAPAAKPKAPRAVRGSVKGKLVAEKFFGAAAKEPVKPEGYEPDQARVFKDAGLHDVHVKHIPEANAYSMVDTRTGKAMVGVTSNGKGRAAGGLEGSELRPINSLNKPAVHDTNNVARNQIQTFASHTEAEAYARKHLTVADTVKEPKAEEAPVHDKGEEELGQRFQNKLSEVRPVRGHEIMPLEKAKAANEKAKAEYAALQEKATKGALTDEDMDRYTELADAMVRHDDSMRFHEEAEAPAEPEQPAAREEQAAPAVESPLTPAAKTELAESIHPDMQGRNVGILTRNVLESHLGRMPTRDEIRGALDDMVRSGHIKREQAIIPGEAQFVHANPIHMAAKAIASGAEGAKAVLDRALHDLPAPLRGMAHETPALIKGEYGFMGQKVGQFLSRTVFRGKLGPVLTQHLVRAKHMLVARLVAGFHPEFAPVLKAVHNKIDEGRVRYNQSFKSISDFVFSGKANRDLVSAALIHFRLHDVKRADFGKQFDYERPDGSIQPITLTPKQIDMVDSVHANNKALMTDYVKELKSRLGLPPNITSAQLATEIAAGNIPDAARVLITPLKVLEGHMDNYVPLARYGGYKNISVYDAAKYAAAKTGADRRAARLHFEPTEGVDAYERAMKNIKERYPAQDVRVHEEDIHEDNMDKAGVNEKQLRDLAAMAGVPDQVFRDFWDAGVGTILNSQGVKSRFGQAKMTPGFSRDMVRVNAEHAFKMSQATNNLKHAAVIDNSMNGIITPPLKDFANRFVTMVNTPMPRAAQSVRSLATIFYLGLKPVSGLVNSSQSMLFAPATLAFLTRNPGNAFKAFAEGSARFTDAISRTMGVPQLMQALSGKEVQSAPERYADILEKAGKKGLAADIRRAHQAGVFENTDNRQAHDIAESGRSSKVGAVGSGLKKAMMWFFNNVETGNRLSSYIAAHEQWDLHKNETPFRRKLNDIGFVGKSAHDFGEFFSDFMNFRGDRTDSPTWAHGTFGKNAEGKTAFNASTLRPIAYALKSWGVNELSRNLLLARSAFRGGFIDRAMYMAIAGSFVAMFGASNVIPGMQAADTLEKGVTNHIVSAQDKIAESGTAGRVAMHGAAGVLGEKITGSVKFGMDLDNLSTRVGLGNVVPTGSIVDMMPAAGMAQQMGEGAHQLATSPNAADKIEGAASMVGKGAQGVAKAVRGYTGNEGFRSKSGSTLVGDESTAKTGQPMMTAMDYMSEALGMTPPQVGVERQLVDRQTRMKQANDLAFDGFTDRIVNAAASKNQTDINKAIEEVKAYNAQALADHEEYRLISGDALEQAVKMKYMQRMFGAAGPRTAPKFARPAMEQEKEKLLRGDLIKRD